MFGKIKDIFKKGEQLMDPLDYRVLECDIHSHLIPGIDDGAQTMEDSLQLASAFAEMGYRKMITTPHVMSDYYKNTPDIINKGCDDVNEALSKEGIKLELDCAAEYYLDEGLKELIASKDLLTFGDNYVLFELPFISEPPNVADIIFEMQLAGYKPVLAHPERYGFYHMDYDKYSEYVNKGVLLQLNINSLTGHYSPQVKKVGERLVQDGLVSLLGSDCHHAGHIELMAHAAKTPAIHQAVNSGKLLNTSL